MKKSLFLIPAAVVVFSCAAMVSHNARDALDAPETFRLERISGQNSVINSDALVSGDVPFFIEFGADSTFTAEYTGGGGRYSAEMVTFSSYRGALGAFAVTDLPGAYPMEIADGARRNDTLVQFVSGQMIVTVSKKGGGAMDGAETLAREIASGTETPPIKPELLSFLPRDGRMEDSGLYFMGQRVFRDRVSGELAEVLLLEFAREGGIASYDVDGGVVQLVKIRYYRPERAKAALNSYLKHRGDRPVILPRQSLEYYTVVNRDMTEAHIADYAEWIYFMPASPRESGGKDLFEYMLRGGS